MQLFVVHVLVAMTMGERIKQRREQLKLSQKTLAVCVGVAYQSVQRWENNETTPKGVNMVNLARCLGVDLKWIVDGDLEKVATTPSGQDDTKDLASLLQMTREVLTSKTPYAESLMMNIKSFHMAVQNHPPGMEDCDDLPDPPSHESHGEKTGT